MKRLLVWVYNVNIDKKYEKMCIKIEW